MGIKRVVDTSFWTDGKMDDLSSEDKYFYLYLLSNPFSTQLGIYEISIKQVAFHLGYSVDTVKVLLDRFENKYGLIIFDPDTSEVAIKNYLKHSVVKGGTPVRDCLIKEIRKVKNRELIDQIFDHVKETVSLNETVRAVIYEYRKYGARIKFSNENKEDNDNDNEESHHESGRNKRDDMAGGGRKRQTVKKHNNPTERELDEDEICAIQRMMDEG